VKHLEPELLAHIALHPNDPAERGVREHLSACSQCRAELDELREIAELSRSARSDVLSPTPPRIWDRITAELELGGEPASREARRTTAGPRRWMLAAAAAVGLIAGVLGTWLVTETTRDETPPPVATTRLEPLAGKSGGGSAEIMQTPNGPELRVGSEGLQAADGFYEVWLINSDAQRMVSLGVLDARGGGTFPIPADAVAQGYRIVDVSLEPYDGNPVHSQDSVIRGNLPA
jgi:anti-sigma-K factor RskA